MIMSIVVGFKFEPHIIAKIAFLYYYFNKIEKKKPHLIHVEFR